MFGECLMPRWIVNARMDVEDAVQFRKDFQDGYLLGKLMVREEMEGMGHLEDPFTESEQVGLIRQMGILYGCWVPED